MSKGFPKKKMTPLTEEELNAVKNHHSSDQRIITKKNYPIIYSLSCNYVRITPADKVERSGDDCLSPVRDRFERGHHLHKGEESNHCCMF